MIPAVPQCVLAAAAAAAAAAVLRRTCVWWRCRTAVLHHPHGRGSSRSNVNVWSSPAPPPPSPPSAAASSPWALRFILTFVELLVPRTMMLLKRARCVPEGHPEEEEEKFKKSRENPQQQQQQQQPSLLCLPDLALENILGRLNAASLLQTSRVCRELRLRCKSDHLWESFVYEKWGKLAGPDSYRKLVEQQQQREHCNASPEQQQRSSNLWFLLRNWLWPPSWISMARECCRRRTRKPLPPAVDSLMAWYWALDSGGFSFRAQVYNREHGHVGFVLSCYDAELSYDRSSDTFRARYPPHGSRSIVQEEAIPWERLRPVPVETPAHSLHSSDCLAELKPGDHVEVQWRRNKDFPYGWWYGVVGHAESCTNSSNDWQCSCQFQRTVWLVFNQYSVGSRWRRAAMNRQSHREEGNEGEGFYGGVRKLRTKDEISIWERLWPAETLE